MKNLLWIGDACCDSGYARCTYYTLETLKKYYKVSVLGLNYLGDPHPHRELYDVYPAWAGGDLFGVRRLEDIVPKVRPDVIVIQIDPYIIPRYMEVLRETKIPVVGTLSVNGKNVQREHLKDLALALFWTEFGRQEAISGGYKGPTDVIPLGVDREIYKPLSTLDARKKLQLPIPDNAFLLGNVNRNQPRKRMDLTIQYFAEWVEMYRREDAYLFLHAAPTGESAVDLKQLAKYYGLHKRIIVSIPDGRKGLPESTLALLYSAFDVLVSTSETEGFHLPSLEAMACGTPVIATEQGGLADWAKSAAYLIRCSQQAFMFGGGANVIGGVPDKTRFIQALEHMYARGTLYERFKEMGLRKSAEERFDWKNIGEAFARSLELNLWQEESDVKEEATV